MSTSASHDSSSINTEKSAGTEWIFSNPMIDNPIYGFFEEQVPHHIPIFDTEDHTYTYLMDSSCLPKSIKWPEAIQREDDVSKFFMEGAQNDTTESPTKHDLDAASATPPLSEVIQREDEVSKSIMEGAQNDKTESPIKHDLDVANATPPLPEAIQREDEVSKSIMEEAQKDKTEYPTKHDLDAASATPPLPKASTDANAGLSQNVKRESPTKHSQDAASVTPPPPVAANQAKQLIHYVSEQQVIVVETGEDVAEKIISFAKGGPRSVSIRSATGKVTKVVLKRRSTSNEIETHEGLCNIVSLYGSFMSIEVEGQRRLTGGLHISLAADGRASFGGLVKGALTAASQVEVTVMSMTSKGKEDS
ncbi:AT-hook motif nuclear-localized protein 2 [Solanum dulcamara]|uniref:AT-hook motif nuclear-localized protein 2 n=1 Tax=Solanum dulcamara TaxID=45834 RepID=UPI0024855575|nr:AT-hook motif nuclear-localized protein 2 [Solanum dulcamara]